MKTCPVCQRLYSDEQMIFCLADGAQLLNVKRNVDLDATWRIAPRVLDPVSTPLPTLPAPQTNHISEQRLATQGPSSSPQGSADPTVTTAPTQQTEKAAATSRSGSKSNTPPKNNGAINVPSESPDSDCDI